MSECIISSYEKTVRGYGRITVNGTVMNHHRVVYCQVNKVTLESIEGLVVRHKCDNPPCINPEHLELGTHQENMADKKLRGRPNGGGPSRSLNDAELAKIRELAAQTVTHKRLAKDYKVSKATIGNVVNRLKAYSNR